MFPRGYIAGRSLSKPVVLNLDNNAWVKSNSAGNFTEIYRQSLRGNTRLSKYGYKSNLSNSMTRCSEQRELSHKIDLIPPTLTYLLNRRKYQSPRSLSTTRDNLSFFFFSPRDPLEIPHCRHVSFRTIAKPWLRKRQDVVSCACLPPLRPMDLYAQRTRTFQTSSYRITRSFAQRALELSPQVTLVAQGHI